MTLFDIHTHRLRDEKGVISILNLSPSHLAQMPQDAVCYYSCGVHPWDTIGECSLNLDSDLWAHPRLVAIGEAGFDRLRGADLSIQRTIFEQHIHLSEMYQKPLIIHCVKAWDELIAAHKKYRPTQPWILHAYRGKEEQTQHLLKLGFLFSIGEQFNPESLQLIPLESLLLETDDATISIQTVYERIAECRKLDFHPFREIIEQNVRKIFHIDEY